jgi:hypothetical protein
MIKVEFKWDPGDRESGIQPGWGEETVVLVEMHGFTLIIGFVPIESRDFSDWRIDQIDVTITGSPGTNIGAIDHPTFWPGVKSGKNHPHRRPGRDRRSRLSDGLARRLTTWGAGTHPRTGEPGYGRALFLRAGPGPPRGRRRWSAVRAACGHGSRVPVPVPAYGLNRRIRAARGATHRREPSVREKRRVTLLSVEADIEPPWGSVCSKTDPRKKEGNPPFWGGAIPGPPEEHREKGG